MKWLCPSSLWLRCLNRLSLCLAGRWVSFLAFQDIDCACILFNCFLLMQEEGRDRYSQCSQGPAYKTNVERGGDAYLERKLLLGPWSWILSSLVVIPMSPLTTMFVWSPHKLCLSVLQWSAILNLDCILAFANQSVGVYLCTHHTMTLLLSWRSFV